MNFVSNVTNNNLIGNNMIKNINEIMNDKDLNDRMKELSDIAVTEGHSYFLNGVPVYKELLVFAQELQKTMPKIKFLPHTYDTASRSVPSSLGNVRVVDEVFVYMDDFPCELGRISWSDNTVSSGEITYGVHSRKIKNAKYGSLRDQHHMVLTNNLGKAVKNARKYLVPYTTQELAQVFYKGMNTKVREVYSEVREALYDGADPVRHNRQAILQEIAFLKKQGVHFITPEFRKVADTIDELMANFTAQETRKVSSVFVRFKQVGDITYADFVEAHNVRDRGPYTGDAHATSCPIDELPQDIAGQVAVLNILKNDDYVSGIGMKIDDRTFWVERG